MSELGNNGMSPFEPLDAVSLAEVRQGILATPEAQSTQPECDALNEQVRRAHDRYVKFRATNSGMLENSAIIFIDLEANSGQSNNNGIAL